MALPLLPGPGARQGPHRVHGPRELRGVHDQGQWPRGLGEGTGGALRVRTHARTHAHRGVHYVGGPFMDGWLSLVFVC